MILLVGSESCAELNPSWSSKTTEPELCWWHGCHQNDFIIFKITPPPEEKSTSTFTLLNKINSAFPFTKRDWQKKLGIFPVHITKTSPIYPNFKVFVVSPFPPPRLQGSSCLSQTPLPVPHFDSPSPSGSGPPGPPVRRPEGSWCPPWSWWVQDVQWEECPT